MNNHCTQANLYHWMLAIAVAGFLALPVTASGGLQERFTPLAAVEDETDWTLANNEDKEKEDETDWTLA